MKRFHYIFWPVLIMAAAFYLRFYPENTGLASCLLPRHDEMNYVPHVVRFLNGEFGVEYFVNPTLYMYVLYAATVVTGWVSVLLGQFESFEAFRLEVTFNPHFIAVTGRVLSMVISSLSVGLVYLVARRLFNFRVALVAAAALAFNVTHARRAVLTGNETLMVFMVLLFFLALLRYLRSLRARSHALSGLLLGLAGSVKYNALIQGVPFFAATMIVWRKRRDSLLKPGYLLGFAAMVAAFFLGSPQIALNMEKFLFDFTHQYGYLHEGFTSFDRAAYQSGYLYYIESFPALNDGVAYGVACALGVIFAMVLAVKKRDEHLILLLCAALPLYLFLGMGSFSRMRFFLPAIPFVLILGAWFIAWAVDKARIPAKGTVYFALSAAALAPAAYQVHVNLEGQYGKTDPRGEIVQWIMDHHDPEARTLEYTHNSYSEFPYARRVIDVYGYEEAWFEREEWAAFERGLYDFTPFVELLNQAKTLAGLKRLIAEEGHRYLLVTMPMDYITAIDRFPEVAPHLTGGFREWNELLAYMAGLPLREKIGDPELRLTMLLYELP